MMSKLKSICLCLFLIIATGCGGGGDSIEPDGNGNGNSNGTSDTDKNGDNNDNTNNKVKSLKISTKKINFGYKGGSEEVTVTTNAESWEVSVDREEFEIEKRSSSFKVSAKENSSYIYSIIGYITVTAEGVEGESVIEVEQAKAPEPEEGYIDPVKDRIIFDHSSVNSDHNISISTNFKTLTCSVDQTWCNPSIIGNKENGFALSVSLNEWWGGDNPRKAVVTIEGKDGDRSLESVVEVYQNPSPLTNYYTAKQTNPSTIRIPYFGGTITVYVTTNVVEWHVEYVGASWLSVKQIDQSRFTITSVPGDKSSQREREYIYLYSGNQKKTIDVIDDIEAEASSDNDDYKYDDSTGWD